MKVRELRDLLNKPEIDQYLDCEVEFEDQMGREYDSINVVAITNEHYIDDNEYEQRLSLSYRRLDDESNKMFTIKRTILYQRKEEQV